MDSEQVEKIRQAVEIEEKYGYKIGRASCRERV